MGALQLTFGRPEALCSVTRRKTMQGSSYTVPAAQCSTRGGAPGGITVTSGLSATAADAAAASAGGLLRAALGTKHSAVGNGWLLVLSFAFSYAAGGPGPDCAGGAMCGRGGVFNAKPVGAGTASVPAAFVPSAKRTCANWHI
jgi:hypothetical protein